MKEIEQIYDATREKFEVWSKSDMLHYRNAACAETLRANQINLSGKQIGGPAEIGDKVGFSILWTQIFKKPPLLLCGCCVTTFGTFEQNTENLEGKIPTRNTAIGAMHPFGNNIEKAFAENNCLELLKQCVGMNMWHFQYVGSPSYNQYAKEIREFCENNTVQIIKLLEPKYLICLHNHTIRKLTKHFPDLIRMTHPSVQQGHPFRAQMKAFLQENF